MSLRLRHRLNEAVVLFVFCRRCRGRNGLAEKLSVSIVGRIADLMSAGVVAKNNLSDHALVLGEMGFFDETIISVVLVLQDKSELFLRSEDFATKKSSILVEIPANFFPHLPVFAGCGGDGLVVGSIVFVNRARAIGIEDDADTNIATILLGKAAKRGGGENSER